jgi:type IV secretory pathway ATPase VirB11/archaellum biosynthesis ATPase
MEMMLHLIIVEKINKMVTAVQWLKTIITHKHDLNLEEALEEALRMEKDQIIIAYSEGESQEGFENEAEEYYNQNYGNDNGE